MEWSLKIDPGFANKWAESSRARLKWLARLDSCSGNDGGFFNPGVSLPVEAHRASGWIPDTSPNS